MHDAPWAIWRPSRPARRNLDVNPVGTVTAADEEDARFASLRASVAGFGRIAASFLASARWPVARQLTQSRAAISLGEFFPECDLGGWLWPDIYAHKSR
jgi:hypothetical protein